MSPDSQTVWSGCSVTPLRKYSLVPVQVRARVIVVFSGVLRSGNTRGRGVASMVSPSRGLFSKVVRRLGV
jgi:hypothetical protein